MLGVVDVCPNGANTRKACLLAKCFNLSRGKFRQGERFCPAGQAPGVALDG